MTVTSPPLVTSSPPGAAVLEISQTIVPPDVRATTGPCTFFSVMSPPPVRAVTDPPADRTTTSPPAVSRRASPLTAPARMSPPDVVALRSPVTLSIRMSPPADESSAPLPAPFTRIWPDCVEILTRPPT